MDNLTIADQIAIHTLIARFAHLLSERDEDGIKELFCENAVLLEENEGGRQVYGVADGISRLQQLCEPTSETCIHSITHLFLFKNGEKCHVKSHFQIFSKIAGENQLYKLGEYMDICTNCNGEWLFYQKKFTI